MTHPRPFFPTDRLVPPVLLLAPLASVASAQGFQEPHTAVDHDPSPTAVEVHLTAAETTWEYVTGVQTTVWAYNGTVPGPTIRANVGDTIRVLFTNDLPEPTTIHWHGLLTPAEVDGSHVSQAPVPPGGTHVYEWTALNDGFHWYHPHVRTFDQVEKGLYGGVLIRDPAKELQLGLDGIEERILFFDDVLLDANDQVVPAFSFSDPLQNATYQLNGREGNLLLVNGKDASSVEMTVENGRTQRWRVVNAANTTFCRLDMRDSAEGMDERVFQIGSDSGFADRAFQLRDVSLTGPNAAEHPSQSLINQMGEGVLLMPGERMDLLFTPIGSDGEVYTVYQHDWFRGRHVATYASDGTIAILDDPLDGSYPKQPFLRIRLEGPDPGTGEFLPPRDLRAYPAFLNPPAGTLPLVMGHSPPDANGNVTFFTQAKMDPQGNMVPLPAPKVTSFDAHDVELGKTYVWEVTNLTHGDHPFHTHGFPFELLEYEFQDDDDPALNFTFQPTLRRMLKDTIRIPPRLGAKGRSRTIARLRVHFEDYGREGRLEAMGERPTFAPDGSWTSGGWLVHCHILEHSARGMLSFFEVQDPSNPFRLLGRFLSGQRGDLSLTATGDVAAAGPVTLHVVNAAPGGRVLLVVGDEAASQALLGGTVVPGYTGPGPFAATFQATADPSGVATFEIDGWQAASAATTLYWQAATPDAGTPKGWALSNALSFERP